jgi:peptide deformylase
MIVTNMSDLTSECEDATISEAYGIIDLLNKELDITDGIGLAANQIGINKKVCILRIPQDDPAHNKDYSFCYHFVNPKIISRQIPFIMKDEGCLSFPGETLRTLRYASVTVADALQPEGRSFYGLAAVAAQHETDHVLGVTMHSQQLVNIKPDQQCNCGSNKQFKYCCAVIMRANNINSR